MFDRKCFFIILLVIAIIYSTAMVSAADFNQTADGQDLAASNQIATFTDLARLIDECDDYEVDLYSDYEFDPSVDGKYESGIEINDLFWVNGNGHAIKANGARVFNVCKEEGSLEVADVVFINNGDSKFDKGGTIYSEGDLFLKNCTFINSRASNEGGAIFSEYFLDISQSNFVNCSSISNNSKGGAISSYGDLFIENSRFANCSSDYGGAIFTCGNAVISSSLFGIVNSQSSPNRAFYGSAIFNKIGKACSIENSQFKNNQALYSGAIDGVIASKCIFENNTKDASNSVLVKCTTSDVLTSDVIISTGISISTKKLTTNYKSGKKFNAVVLSKPGGERLSGVMVYLYVLTGSYYKYYEAISDENGVASFSLSSLSPGTHKISMILEDTISLADFSSAIVIKKLNAKLSASKFTTTYGSKKLWTIKLKDTTNNKAISNMKITLKVFTGKKYKTYSVKTDSNGKATFKASKLKSGKHKVVLSISNSRYNCKPLTSSIKIKKDTLKYHIVRQTLDVGGLIGVYVKLKSTKKYKNGIKLTLKVYTGKKFKKYTLVTGHDDENNEDGVAIFFSNKFSKGTHKVEISPANSNYRGVVKTKLVIKSSSEKYNPMTILFTKGKTVYK